MEYPKLGKTRRNIYMGPEYLDLEAIVINERKRTGRALSVSDLIRKACAEYANAYWTRIATGTRVTTESSRQRPTDV